MYFFAFVLHQMRHHTAGILTDFQNKDFLSAMLVLSVYQSRKKKIVSLCGRRKIFEKMKEKDEKKNKKAYGTLCHTLFL